MSKRDQRSVLVIAEFGTLNGGENSFLTVASALKEEGWRFTVTAVAGTPLAQACKQRGLETIDFNFFQSFGPSGISQRKPLDSLRAELRDIIRDDPPDLIHCNSLSTSRIVGPVAREENVPALGYLRDIIKVNKTVIGDINQLGAIVAVSEATRRFHIAQGLSDLKSKTIFNGIELAQFRPRESHQVTPPFRLLYVGQIGMRKGLDTLLDAILLLPESLELELELVGERHSLKNEAIAYESHLHQLAEEINRLPTKQVRFVGRRSDVAARMRRADLLVHPANQEPLGRVLLEAFASGLPVVATNVGGTPEIFSGLDNWPVLVPPKSPAELAASIDRVLCLSAEEREQLSAEVRQIAESRFDVKQTAVHLNTAYRALISYEFSAND